MKKVLVIAYYWPPAGGPGVQRWLKFLTYLPEFGITPILYIPDNPHYPLVDRSLVQEVPKGLKIYRHPIREPYRWAGIFSKKKTDRISSGIIEKQTEQSFLERILLWARGNLFIPDARKFWIKPSMAYLSEIIKNEAVKTVITTGPPHSLHLIGLGLKDRLGVRWIADFRDPWTNIGYHKKLKLTKASQKKHKELEQKVLQSADRIIVTSYTTQKEFTQLTKTPITVITNGHDLDPPPKNGPLDKKFTLSHIGSLLSGRNPNNLWQVLKELNTEVPGFKEDFQLQLAGVVSDEIVEDLKRYKLFPQTKLLGYLAHDRAVLLQQKSQVLLLVEIDTVETRGIIPGKLFEYLAARRPILAIGPKDWDASIIIAQTGSGSLFPYTDHNGLKTLLLSYYRAYKKGELTIDPKNVELYGRRQLTKKLAEII